MRLGSASRTRCLLVPGEVGCRLPHPSSAGPAIRRLRPFTCHPLWTFQAHTHRTAPKPGRQDSNPQPTELESVALPVELRPNVGRHKESRPVRDPDGRLARRSYAPLQPPPTRVLDAFAWAEAVQARPPPAQRRALRVRLLRPGHHCQLQTRVSLCLRREYGPNATTATIYRDQSPSSPLRTRKRSPRPARRTRAPSPHRRTARVRIGLSSSATGCCVTPPNATPALTDR